MVTDCRTEGDSDEESCAHLPVERGGDSCDHDLAGQDDAKPQHRFRKGSQAAEECLSEIFARGHGVLLGVVNRGIRPFASTVK